MASLEFSDEENELGSDANRKDQSYENGDGFGSDEAEEDRTEQNPDDEDFEIARKIDPSTSKKRIVRKPLPKLNAERIQGPKGVQTIEKYFEGFKFQGKGHEKSDLDKIMKRLEHWAHRLFPKYQFDDFLDKIAALGSKKNVQVYLKRYRLGMETCIVDEIDPEDETGTETGEQQAPEEEPVDEFDKLIAEQIEKQRRVTDEQEIQANTSIFAKPSGNVLGTAKPTEMSEEVKARIEANRKLAIEKKNARLKKIEEESKKRKLEESQDDFEVYETSNTQIRNGVSGPEESNKDVPEKIQSPSVDASAMETSSSQSEETIAKENNNDVSEKIQSQSLNVSAMEISSSEPEKRVTKESNKDVSEKIKSSSFDASPMEKSIDQSEKRVAKIQDPGKVIISSDSEEGQSRIDAASQLLSDDLNSDALKANKLGNRQTKNILFADSIEILDDRESFNVSKSSEIPNKTFANSDVLENISNDEMEHSNVAKIYGSSSKKSKEDPERLLSKEELQKEIDNAIEEIISRNAHRHK